MRQCRDDMFDGIDKGIYEEMWTSLFRQADFFNVVSPVRLEIQDTILEMLVGATQYPIDNVTIVHTIKHKWNEKL